MDGVIEKLPPYIDTDYGRAYLTVATWDGGWQVCYCDQGGFAIRGTWYKGRSPAEALLNLKEDYFDIIDLLNRPTVTAPEDLESRQ